MSKRYVVIDDAGIALNTIIWDGESDWSPPEGCTVALEDSEEAQAAVAAREESDAVAAREAADQAARDAADQESGEQGIL